MSNCTNCDNKCNHEIDKLPQSIPYVAHESTMTRIERVLKRQWVVIILLIVMLVGTNAAWLWYESQFEVVETTTEIVQDNPNGNNNYIGNDGNTTNSPQK